MNDRHWDLTRTLDRVIDVDPLAVVRIYQQVDPADGNAFLLAELPAATLQEMLTAPQPADPDAWEHEQQAKRDAADAVARLKALPLDTITADDVEAIAATMTDALRSHVRADDA